MFHAARPEQMRRSCSVSPFVCAPRFTRGGGLVHRAVACRVEATNFGLTRDCLRSTRTRPCRGSSASTSGHARSMEGRLSDFGQSRVVDYGKDTRAGAARKEVESKSIWSAVATHLLRMSDKGPAKRMCGSSDVELRDALVVHPQLSVLGGSEIVCALVARALVELGCRVRLGYGGAIDDEVRRLLCAPRVELVNYAPGISAGLPILDTYPELLRLKLQLARIQKPDSEYEIFTQSLVPFRRSGKQTRRILYVHYPTLRADEATSNATLRKLYLAPARIYLEAYLREIDTVICNSEFTRHAILEFWGCLSIPEPVVVYPASLGQFNPTKSWAARKNQCVYVARLSRFKRHDILASLAKEIPECQFISVGSSTGTYSSYIEELVQQKPPNYCIRAAASSKQVSALLEESKLYVHCARNEHFGISILEAMKAGAVPLVHRSGGPCEFVPSQLQWGSMDELAAKCRRLLGDQIEWEYWRGRTLRLAEQFTPERFQTEFLEAVASY